MGKGPASLMVGGETMALGLMLMTCGGMGKQSMLMDMCFTASMALICGAPTWLTSKALMAQDAETMSKDVVEAEATFSLCMTCRSAPLRVVPMNLLGFLAWVKKVL